MSRRSLPVPIATNLSWFFSFFSTINIHSFFLYTGKEEMAEKTPDVPIMTAYEKRQQLVAATLPRIQRVIAEHVEKATIMPVFVAESSLPGWQSGDLYLAVERWLHAKGYTFGRHTQERVEQSDDRFGTGNSYTIKESGFLIGYRENNDD
jgi:hypothetical protein